MLSPIRKLGTVYELNNIFVAFPLASGTAQTGPMKPSAQVWGTPGFT